VGTSEVHAAEGKVSSCLMHLEASLFNIVLRRNQLPEVADHLKSGSLLSREAMRTRPFGTNRVENKPDFLKNNPEPTIMTIVYCSILINSRIIEIADASVDVEQM
jgi:hypothetical protein